MEETISFQILSDTKNIIFERFHICTWEIGTHKPIIEFGIDIQGLNIQDLDIINLTLYTPWKIKVFSDLFSEIKKDDNARFIFNESIRNTSNLNSSSELGVIHEFSNDSKLCILPIILNFDNNKLLIKIDLKHYKEAQLNDNVYVRFYIIPENDKISIQKIGISKSTIIYDTKINERRNIPGILLREISKLYYPNIKSCYNFNIVPNNMDITFEDKHLKSVRNLEYNSFKEYFKQLIANKKIKIENKELLVVFNKHSDNDSTYSFFTIYTKEHFGLKQISIVLLLNLLCSFLFFLPSYRGKVYKHDISFIENIKIAPIELVLVILIIMGSITYIFNPSNIFKR